MRCRCDNTTPPVRYRYLRNPENHGFWMSVVHLFVVRPIVVNLCAPASAPRYRTLPGHAVCPCVIAMPSCAS